MIGLSITIATCRWMEIYCPRTWCSAVRACAYASSSIAGSRSDERAARDFRTGGALGAVAGAGQAQFVLTYRGPAGRRLSRITNLVLRSRSLRWDHHGGSLGQRA